MIFLHHSYYHFTYLARALRARGWDASAITTLPPGVDSQFMLGEDRSFYDPDPEQARRNIDAIYRTVLERTGMVHFSGAGHMSFYADNLGYRFPWDFVELKRRGILIGYTISGCNDGVAQSEIYRTTGGLCDKCVWQDRPDVCSDEKNSGWGKRLALMCDLVSVETDWPAPARRGSKFFHEPLTMCLDHKEWSPDLEIPANLRIKHEAGELVVMHTVGNLTTRQAGSRDIKGSGAVERAVSALKAEGSPICFLSRSDIPQSQMPYFQVQADVIVDQLNYGRCGATARQSLMLGRPVIGNLRPREPADFAPLRSLAECPVVHADEETIYGTLKDLLRSPDRRAEAGARGREFALRWHSPETCAARYELVYDGLMAGRSPASVQAELREAA